MTIIPAFRRLGHEDCLEFKASLSYIAKPNLISYVGKKGGGKLMFVECILPFDFWLQFIASCYWSIKWKLKCPYS